MKKRQTLTALILVSISSLHAQGNVELRLYKAPARMANIVLKTLEVKKDTPEELTKGLNSLTKSRKITLLLHKEGAIKDENTLTARKSNGRFLDPKTQLNRSLGYNLEAKINQEDIGAEVRFDFKINASNKRSSDSYFNRTLKLGYTIQDQNWHLLSYWQEPNESYFALARGANIPKPFHPNPQHQTTSAKLALYQVAQEDLNKFQRAASRNPNLNVSSLAKRGKLLRATLLHTNSKQAAKSSNSYKKTIKKRSGTASETYGFIAEASIRPEEDQVNYRLKAEWRQETSSSKSNTLTFNFTDTIAKGASRVIVSESEKAFGNQRTVLLLWDKTPKTK